MWDVIGRWNRRTTLSSVKLKSQQQDLVPASIKQQHVPELLSKSCQPTEWSIVIAASSIVQQWSKDHLSTIEGSRTTCFIQVDWARKISRQHLVKDLGFLWYSLVLGESGSRQFYHKSEVTLSNCRYTHQRLGISISLFWSIDHSSSNSIDFLWALMVYSLKDSRQSQSWKKRLDSSCSTSPSKEFHFYRYRWMDMWQLVVSKRRKFSFG